MSKLQSPPRIKKLLKEVTYSDNHLYVPSAFALELVAFIKLINGPEGEENKTPVLHMKILDKLDRGSRKIANLVFRGAAKSTLMEYLFFYMIVNNELPKMKNIRFALYISDTIENGVKTMRSSLEYRWENSEFLQKYIPHAKFNDTVWRFDNIDGKKFIIKGYGVATGVRGSRELGTRPQIAFIDDILSDKSASSVAEITSIRKVIHAAVNAALHPTNRIQLWNGTPFQEGDPLYEAIESGVWDSSVFPVAEKFDDTTTRANFKSAWPDRWTYDAIKSLYEDAKKENELDSFYQEFMLQLTPDGERLLDFDNDFKWFDGSNIQDAHYMYNWYITTDLATSEKTSSNWTVIGLWAVNSAGYWMLIDAKLTHQTVEKSMQMIFRYAEKLPVLEVAIETNGQQEGFIGFFEQEMIRKNIFFKIVQMKRSADKFQQLNNVVPAIKDGRYWINKKIFDKTKKDGEIQFLDEFENEIDNVTLKKIKAKSDDVLDMISATQYIKPWVPDPAAYRRHNAGLIWEEEKEEVETKSMDSYIV